MTTKWYVIDFIMFAEEIIKKYEEKIHALASELSNSQKRCEQYVQAYDSLLVQIRELQRYRFGKKSERFIDPEHPQLNLLDDNQNKFIEADGAGDVIDSDIKVTAHARKKKNKAEKNIPVRIDIIPVPDEQKQCTCGKCKKSFVMKLKK